MWILKINSLVGRWYLKYLEYTGRPHTDVQSLPLLLVKLLLVTPFHFSRTVALPIMIFCAVYAPGIALILVGIYGICTIADFYTIYTDRVREIPPNGMKVRIEWNSDRQVTQN